MMNFIKHICLIGLSCLCMTSLAAKEAKDTLGIKHKTSKKEHYRDIGFSATDYSLQKRYRPKNDMFAKGNFFNNSFISLTGEAMQLLPVNGKSFSTQYALGINFGKWINENNAVRLNGTVGSFVRNTDGNRLLTTGAEIDHMFNLTSYIWGYRRARFCDISTVGGLGYMFSYDEGSYIGYYNVHLGLNFATKVGRDMDLFFEPLAYFVGNGMTRYDDLNWRNYNFAPAFKVGLSYLVQPKEYKRQKVDYMEDSFITLAAGVQFEHSGLVLSSLGMMKSLRPHLAVGFGKMYRDGFGFRTTASHSNDIWKVTADGKKLQAGYTALRLEAMYDFMSLNKNLRDDFPFALSLLLGPEAGIVNKKDVTRNIRHVYVGATGGLQAKVRVSKGAALFLEPRFSAIQYSDLTGSAETPAERANYKDVLFNCNLGLEMALGKGRYDRRYQDGDFPDDRQEDDFIAKRFFDNTFISLTGESLQLLPSNGSTYSTQYAVGGNIGKWIDQYNAIRLGASIGTFVKNAEPSRLYNFGVEADYLFNISSYTDGYRRDRFCDVSTVAGIGYRLSRKDGSYKDYINAHFGFNFAMKVGRDIDLFFEPLAYFQGDDMIWRKTGESTWRDNLNFENYIFAPALKVGLTYIVQPKEHKRPVVDYGKGSFISIAGGVQFEHSGLVLNSLGMMKSLRPHLAVGFGKMYRDGFGFRTTVAHSNDIWKVAAGGKKLQAGYTALRLEAMYDFMSLNKNLREDFPFALSLLLGPEAGIVKKEEVGRDIKHVYVGATGGLQAKVRVSKEAALFVEPRFSAIQYSDLINASQRANYKDVLFNCNLGVEIALGGQKRHDRRFISERFFDNTFISLTGESLQLLPANGSTYSTQYAVGGNIGKWIDPYNAIRLGASIGTFVKNAESNRLYNFGVEADYLFNISSYTDGYRTDRFCDVSTVAGIGYRLSQKNGSYKDYINAHFGFNFAMKVGRDIDLFLEPLAYFQGDDMIWKNTGESTWRDNININAFIPAPALKVGLTYMIQPKEGGRQKVDYGEHSFVSYGGGVQFEHSSLVLNSLGMMKSLRMHNMFSYGKVYRKGFGIRTTVAHSNDIWKVAADGKNLMAGYTALRLEAMYDLMSLNKNLGEDFPFSLSLLVGPEAGLVKKEDVDREIRHVYVGAAGGIQAKVRISKAVSIFIEPRCSAIQYSDMINAAQRANYKDVLFNCNLGIEIRSKR